MMIIKDRRLCAVAKMAMLAICCTVGYLLNNWPRLLRAQVVRSNENEFGVKFHDFIDGQTVQLLNCLLRETEREL